MNISSVIKLVISILFTAIFSQVCPAQELMEIKGTVRSVSGSLCRAPLPSWRVRQRESSQTATDGSHSKPAKDKCWK